MTWNVLISCPHLQRTIHLYSTILRDNEISYDLPEITQNLTESELISIIDQYDGVIAGDDEFSQKVLDRGSRLKIISKWGIGVDAIDLDAAKNLGITVTNTPNMFGDEVADLVMGYLIMLTRKMHKIDSLVRTGKWKKAQIQGVSLRGKTIGIVGVGSIGKSVAERAVASGLNPIGYDIFSIDQEFKDKSGLIQVDLDELLQRSDFISLNCNLTSENYHLINKRAFELMKNKVYLINTARGPLIDESALVWALEQQKVAGVALDVFENEPFSPVNPLMKFENCIFGSHNSSNTYEAVLRTNEVAIRNLIEFLKAVKK